MKKIGIMSMQRIANYGSFLQSYGLMELLKSIDSEVEVSFLDYKPGPILIEGESKSKLKKAIELMFSNVDIKDKYLYYKHKKNYGSRFYPLLGISSEMNYSTDVDLQIIGSDEVFNCVQSNQNVGYSRDLFGFESKANKVISYAGSFGNTTVKKITDSGILKTVTSDLSALDYISVRDMNSYKIVRELTGMEPNINIDPVLAYDFMNNEQSIPQNRLHDNKYIVIYGYSGRFSSEENNEIKKLARMKECEIISIGGPQSCSDKYVDCSPFEVLAYFRDAEFIITDTFHGTIFSIINEKKFATVIRKSKEGAYGNEEKLGYLLKMFGLSSRNIVDVDLGKLSGLWDSEIEYGPVNERLNIERTKAFEYLSEILKEL